MQDFERDQAAHIAIDAADVWLRSQARLKVPAGFDGPLQFDNAEDALEWLFLDCAIYNARQHARPKLIMHYPPEHFAQFSRVCLCDFVARYASNPDWIYFDYHRERFCQIFGHYHITPSAWNEITQEVAAVWRVVARFAGDKCIELAAEAAAASAARSRPSSSHLNAPSDSEHLPLTSGPETITLQQNTPFSEHASPRASSDSIDSRQNLDLELAASANLASPARGASQSSHTQESPRKGTSGHANEMSLHKKMEANETGMNNPNGPCESCLKKWRKSHPDEPIPESFCRVMQNRDFKQHLRCNNCTREHGSALRCNIAEPLERQAFTSKPGGLKTSEFESLWKAILKASKGDRAVALAFSGQLPVMDTRSAIQLVHESIPKDIRKGRK